jgi:hypothetical protein
VCLISHFILSFVFYLVGFACQYPNNSDNNNVDHLVSVRDIHNLNMYDTFLVLDRGNKKDGISYILILKIKFLKSTIIILF